MSHPTHICSFWDPGLENYLNGLGFKCSAKKASKRLNLIVYTQLNQFNKY